MPKASAKLTETVGKPVETVPADFDQKHIGGCTDF